MAASPSDPPARRNGCLIVGGDSHDMDFARLEILRRLSAYPHLRIEVVAEYPEEARLDACDFVIAYTCNRAPSDTAQIAMRNHLERGGRWLALHASNALYTFTDTGVTPRNDKDPFFATLGSQFLAHPPACVFGVDIDDPDHPLVAGLQAFETFDELYLSRLIGAPRILLSTRFEGATPNFAQKTWSGDRRHPVLYLHQVGDGEVVYFSLGHARGRYDAPHRAPILPTAEHSSWDTLAFNEILDRCLRWVARI